MVYVILPFITAAAVVLFSIPSIIRVADFKNIFEYPAERKLHKQKTPRIGGIAIFAAVLFSYALWSYSFYTNTSLIQNNSFQFALACLLILFFVGVKDDIIGVSPFKKLLAQLIVAVIIVVPGDVRLTGLHGILGIHEIPYWTSVVFTMFTFIVVINAFNLIDGIDGLAAGIGFITSVTFGLWFYVANNFGLSCMAFSLAGALLGTLRYNFYPAKIFMGDCGSLIIGFLSAYFCINFIESNINNDDFISAPVFAMAVLGVPLFDTLRIFTVRVMNKRSPFEGDTNHIHHRILELVLSQRKTVFILFAINILFILTAYLLRNINPNVLIALILLLAVSLNVLLTVLKRNMINRHA